MLEASHCPVNVYGTDALSAADQGLLSTAVLLLATQQETVFQMQAARLAATIPELFAPGCSVRLATENGRSLLAKAAFTASRCDPTRTCVLVCRVLACLLAQLAIT